MAAIVSHETETNIHVYIYIYIYKFPIQHSTSDQAQDTEAYTHQNKHNNEMFIQYLVKLDQQS
jgi:hypothetical protein